jgi:hypothetical protein
MLTPGSQSETVMNPAELPRYSHSHSDSPPFAIRELCELLRDADKQGLNVFDVTGNLRTHSGEWDNTNVFRMAKKIGLRPPDCSEVYYDYPEPVSQNDPGMIIYWPEERGGMDEPYPDRVEMLPRDGFIPPAGFGLGLLEKDMERIKSFYLLTGCGYMEDGSWVSYGNGWFDITDDGLWE